MKVDLGSKIENFMRDVLENGSDKDVPPSSLEIHLAQDKTSPIHENPSHKKFGKFLLLGLTILSLAGPVLAQDKENNGNMQPGSFQHEVAEVQAKSENAGYVGHNIHISTHIMHENVGNNYEKIQDLGETTNNSITRDSGECDVNITYSQDGRSAFLGYTDEMQKLSSPQTEAQLKLNREMVLLHEMSHCEFAKIHNPLLVDGNPQLQKKINYFLKYNDGSRNSEAGKASSLVTTLNENFADTYAVIQMIKIHGMTPDMTRMVHSMAAQRQEKTLLQGEVDFVEAHATENAMKDILQPSTLEKIQNTQNPDNLKQIALEIANHSVGKLYATYFDIASQNLTLNSFENGVQSIVLERIAQPYLHTQKAQTSTQHPYDTINTSFAVKVSDAVMAKIDLNQITITPKQIKQDGIEFNQDQIRLVYNVIQNVVKEDLLSDTLQMRQANREYMSYIQKNFQADSTDYLNSKNTPIEVAEKVFAVQDKYIMQEGSATQKSSLMSRINQNREPANQNVEIMAENSPSMSLSSKIQQIRQANNTSSVNSSLTSQRSVQIK